MVALVDLITFIIGTILSVAVFSRQPNSRVFQAFGLTSLGMMGWNLCIFLLIAKIGPSIVPGRLGFSFLPVMTAGFIWFISSYPTVSRRARLWTFIGFITGIIFFIIPLLPQFVTYVQIVDGFITGDLNPILFPLWSIYYFFTLLCIFIALIIKTIKVHGIDKLRQRQIDRKSTRLNSSHSRASRMPSSA